MVERAEQVVAPGDMVWYVEKSDTEGRNCPMCGQFHTPWAVCGPAKVIAVAYEQFLSGALSILQVRVAVRHPEDDFEDEYGRCVDNASRGVFHSEADAQTECDRRNAQEWPGRGPWEA